MGAIPTVWPAGDGGQVPGGGRRERGHGRGGPTGAGSKRGSAGFGEVGERCVEGRTTAVQDGSAEVGRRFFGPGAAGGPSPAQEALRVDSAMPAESTLRRATSRGRGRPSARPKLERRLPDARGWNARARECSTRELESTESRFSPLHRAEALWSAAHPAPAGLPRRGPSPAATIRRGSRALVHEGQQRQGAGPQPTWTAELDGQVVGVGPSSRRVACGAASLRPFDVVPVPPRGISELRRSAHRAARARHPRVFVLVHADPVLRTCTRLTSTCTAQRCRPRRAGSPAQGRVGHGGTPGTPGPPGVPRPDRPPKSAPDFGPPKNHPQNPGTRPRCDPAPAHPLDRSARASARPMPRRARRAPWPCG